MGWLKRGSDRTGHGSRGSVDRNTDVRGPEPRRAGTGATGASRELAVYLDELLAAGGVSAAAALVGSPTGVIGTAFAPQSESRSPAEATPLFDLASLTKPFVASVAMRFDLEGRLPLDLPVGEVWPESTPELARRTLSDLLRHRAGFQAWTPLYSRCRTVLRVPTVLVGGGLLGAAPGTYSDLGYILWGLAAERWLETPLADLLALELGSFGAPGELISSPGASSGVLPCRLGNAREVELALRQGVELAPGPGPRRGEVQDGNARFLGGLAGHAGLFGSTRALWRLAREWLRPGTMLDPSTVGDALGGPGPYALGWARKREGDSPVLSDRAFGHTGFTGGSLWIDPTSKGIFVLLAHRRAVSVDLAPWRQRFLRLAAGLE